MFLSMLLGFASSILCCKWQHRFTLILFLKPESKISFTGPKRRFSQFCASSRGSRLEDNIFLCVFYLLDQLLWLIVSSFIFKSSSVTSLSDPASLCFFHMTLCQIFHFILIRTLVITFKDHPDNPDNPALHLNILHLITFAKSPFYHVS